MSESLRVLVDVAALLLLALLATALARRAGMLLRRGDTERVVEALVAVVLVAILFAATAFRMGES